MTKDDKPYFESIVDTDPGKSSNSHVIEKRPPVRFNNGIVYEGSWLGETREGQGVQVWPDGARY